MSTHEDQSISGKSLDVVEHKSSSPPATGGLVQEGTTSTTGTGSGSLDYSSVESQGKVNASGSDGESSEKLNENKSTQKGQPRSLLRTISAPPDEHAGNFQIGSNGVRYSGQFAQVGSQTMINPSSNSTLQTSSSLSQPPTQTLADQLAQTGIPHKKSSSDNSGNKKHHKSTPPLPPGDDVRNIKGHQPHHSQQLPQTGVSQSVNQHGGVNSHEMSQQQQQHMRQSPKHKHSTRPGEIRGQSVDRVAGHDSRGGGGANIRGQQRMHMSKYAPQPQQQYPPHVQMYHNQQMIGMNQVPPQQQNNAQQLGQSHFQGAPYMYYQSPGSVQPFQQPMLQQQTQQQGLRSGPPGSEATANTNRSKNNNSNSNRSNSKSVANNSGAGSGVSSGHSTPSTSTPVSSLSTSPHLMPQPGQQVGGLSPLPPTQNIVQQQQQVGGVGPFGPNINMVPYGVHQGQQMRNAQYYGNQIGVSYGMGSMHQQQTLPQMQQHQMQPQQQQMAPANVPPQKEKRKLVLKDKEGNIVDVKELAKKDNSSASVFATSEESNVNASENVATEDKQSSQISTLRATSDGTDKNAEMKKNIPAEVSSGGPSTETKFEKNGSVNNETTTQPAISSKAISSTVNDEVDSAATVSPLNTSSVDEVKRVYKVYDPLSDKAVDEKSSVNKDDIMANQHRDLPPKVPEKKREDVDTQSDTGNIKISAKVDNPSNTGVISVPGMIAIPTATISPGGVLDKRSKKNKLKEKMALADNNMNKDDMLDAYISSTKREDDVQKVTETEKTPETKDVSEAVESHKEEEEDSWEVQASKIEAEAEKLKEIEEEKEKEKPAAVPAKRSLRPGGGVEKKSGSSSGAKQNVIRYEYKKSELIKLKPLLDRLERPPECSNYVNIVCGDSSSGSGSGRQKDGNWKGQQGGQHHQGGSHVQQHSGGDGGWQRGHVQPHQHSGGGRKTRNPAPPMVKKVITDPLEAMTREVTDILNKITPQTFEKLTTNLSEIQVHDSQMLETLVRLVFDKAVTEPNYAMLYADMCVTLDNANKYANFFNVVFNKDTNQFFWIKDMQYSNELAGPYRTPEDCLNAILAEVPPPLQPVTHAVALDRIIVVGGILASIIKSVDREEYFVSFVPLVDVDESLISPQLFHSHETAYRSGLKKHSFQKILVTTCQEEYQQSISSQGIYGEPAIRRARLMQQKSSMDPDEFEFNLEELNNFEMAVKKRKMGNIRFIGELCKRKMIKTNTMHLCIQNLLSVEEGQKVDGGNIELVCKLLTSIGQKLDDESGGRGRENDVMDSYFAKLAELRKSKDLFSRIRFSIDEVVELRHNNWVARVEQDGPATLEEIRKRAAEDEDRKMLAQQQLHAGHHHGKGRGGGVRAGSGDVRNTGRVSQANSARTSNNDRRTGSGASDRRSSGGENSSRVKAGKSLEIKQHERTHSPQIQPKEIVISADMLKKRTATIVNEFVSSGNEQEALECLAELPAQAAGFLVTNILEKYVDSIKIPEREMMLRLCDVLMPQLHAASAHVEKALKTCENLVCLVDLMVDSKLAPELTGEVMRVLIKGRACRREMFDQLLADLRKANKVDEFGVSDEEFQAAHDRLRSKL